jgi:hypothetical protein
MSIGADARVPGLTRRSFLLMAGAGGAAAAVWLGGRHRSAMAKSMDSGWPEWLLDASNREAVQRLGNAYRAAHASEREASVLLDRIDHALAVAAATESSPKDPAVLLQGRVRHEYAWGEVVRVDGWVLSVTEARLYALVALESDPAGGT